MLATSRGMASPVGTATFTVSYTTRWDTIIARNQIILINLIETLC
jgi:hypothetical protein